MKTTTPKKAAAPMKSKKNLTRFSYETAAFEGWRLNLSKAGTTFTRYFPDKKLGPQAIPRRRRENPGGTQGAHRGLEARGRQIGPGHDQEGGKAAG